MSSALLRLQKLPNPDSCPPCTTLHCTLTSACGHRSMHPSRVIFWLAALQERVDACISPWRRQGNGDDRWLFCNIQNRMYSNRRKISRFVHFSGWTSQVKHRCPTQIFPGETKLAMAQPVVVQTQAALLFLPDIHQARTCAVDRGTLTVVSGALGASATLCWCGCRCVL